jgi:serine/threonine-protein kinase
MHDGRLPCAAPPRVVVERVVVPGRRELCGRVVGDRYGVTKLLGAGGMGEVYEAEHLALGRMVAIKVVRAELAADRRASSRLRHEARVAAAVAHPNVCEVFDVGRLDDGTPFVVMERLQGRTLAERLRGEHVIPWADLRDIGSQILSALAAAHGKGIVHCDLKPENVFLGHRLGIGPVVKILDFGIARTSPSDESNVVTPNAAAVVGTPYYMSPEQARGDRDLDGRVDLWAVGVMLYEALTGHRPFDAGNYNALLMQILTSRHVPVRALRADAPIGVGEVVDRALAKAREERFASALELIEALGRVEVGGAPVTRPMVPAPRRGTFIRSDETMVLDEGGELAGSSTDAMSTAGYDPEATIVDEPSFLEDSVTIVRPEGGFPGAPRTK